MNNEELNTKRDEEAVVVDKYAVAPEAPVEVSKDAPVEVASKAQPDKKKKSVPQAAANAAVSGNATDDVLLEQCVVKNKFARKSLTIHHVQRRLVEWGYVDAGADKDGWYGDHTLRAVAAFQADHSLDGAGVMNAATLVALFEGDHNVNVVA